MENLKIRRAEKNDIEIIAEFNRSMAFETERVKLDKQTAGRGVQRLFQRPELGCYIVAERADRVVASLMITYEWSDWRDGVVWWIQSVYVLPNHRRQGIYRCLYAFVKTLALQTPDVRGIRLYVNKGNEIAQSTYRSLDMKETAYKLYEEMFQKTEKGRPNR